MKFMKINKDESKADLTPFPPFLRK